VVRGKLFLGPQNIRFKSAGLENIGVKKGREREIFKFAKDGRGGMGANRRSKNWVNVFKEHERMDHVEERRFGNVGGGGGGYSEKQM